MSIGSAIGGLFGGGPKMPQFDVAGTATKQQDYNDTAFKENAGAAGRSGPFGSSQYALDPVTGLPTGGVNTTLNPALGAGSFANNLGLLGGQLPGTTIDFTNTTPQQIASQNYAAYAAMTAPQRAQQQEATNVDLTNRGLPVGSEPWNKAMTNQTMAFNLADQNAAAQAWNQVPGMQATMTNTAIQQGQSPYQLAGLNLGLLGGLNTLAPQAGQVQTGPVDYSSLAKTGYQGQVDAYKADKASDAALLNTLGMGAGMLLGGPMGASLGSSAMGLFGGGNSGVPSYGATSWTPQQFQSAWNSATPQPRGLFNQ